MPSQAESAHRPTRRSRRSPRNSAASTPSQIPLTQDMELSTDTSSDRHSDRPTRILRRVEQDVASEDPAPLNLHPLPPHTPPRPRSMYEGSVSKQPNGKNSAPEIPQSKKRSPKNQVQKQSGAASPMPVFNGTHPSTPRAQSLTPSRMNETSARAYAGPTFHASPAASSLPIPKFFSKSVPNVDKTTSLKRLMQQEASETTSKSEGSPPQENRQPAQDHRAREESPLDIFFRADREAKAPSGSPAKDLGVNNSQEQLGALLSNSQTPPRHHSRQPTDGAANGMFAFEMDGAAAENPPGAAHPAKSSPNSTSGQLYPYPSTSEAERKEEQRKAQTAALKQLIYSPRPQLSHNASNGQRPPSSNLRQEVMMPNSPERVNVPDYPSTPTPTRVQRPYTRADARAQSHQNGKTSPYTPFTSSNSLSQGSHPTPTRNSSNAKSMEDDLRRILKLDVLGERATPVRS